MVGGNNLPAELLHELLAARCGHSQCFEVHHFCKCSPIQLCLLRRLGCDDRLCHNAAQRPARGRCCCQPEGAGPGRPTAHDAVYRQGLKGDRAAPNRKYVLCCWSQSNDHTADDMHSSGLQTHDACMHVERRIQQCQQATTRALHAAHAAMLPEIGVLSRHQQASLGLAATDGRRAVRTGHWV